MSEKDYFYSITKKKIIKIKIDPDKIIKLFYDFEIKIPDIENLKDKKIKDKEIYIRKLKKEISKLENLIPLYDIYSKDIYLIKKNRVFKRVYYDHYRFINKNQYDIFVKEYEFLKNSNNLNKNQKLQLEKIKRNIDFLSNYDLDVMFESYLKSIYFGSNEVGKDLTYCKKPTFIPYIESSKPYYSRSELINLGLNLQIIKEDKTFYDDKKLTNLCKKVTRNDLTSDIIINHQNFIRKNNSKHIVQFYSFLGYYFINSYLRNKKSYRDKFLEKLILNMWSLILKAPRLSYLRKKNYVLYRFVDDISYLSHLNEGDIYVDSSFVSTTRNPFYKKNDTFGFNLIKIIINSNSKILCMETYSHFKSEQEVLFPPGSKFKLLSIDSNYTYYHTDDNLQNLIEKKYEFEYIGNEKPFIDSSTHEDSGEIPLIDFKNIILNGNTIEDKINNFLDKYTNKNKQFYVILNNKKYYFYCDYYDSSELYKKFFFIKNQSNGFYIYSFNDDGKYNFCIEINDYISVNYLNKFTDFTNFDKEDFLIFISFLSNSFKIPRVILHPKYFSNIYFYNNLLVKEEAIGEYSADINYYNYDFYQYIKYNKKQYDSIFINSEFSYSNLDKFDEINASSILNKNDRDSIYSIFLSLNNKNIKLSKFYLYISENYFDYFKYLKKKINRFFKKKSPFYKPFYSFYPLKYLYSKNLISVLPKNLPKKLNFNNELDNDFLMKNNRDIMRR